ncbi:LuxR family transcriptional regulator [Paractinoplanes abujensis]|uniref:Quercetin dioxygenase-like cupin family protein n=1 Tax=Paractinoplanes abujensis TaxID=882441 RepID=A0A7W7CUC2_9ACTN|nr:cupin domain-containing protein [Actinoplanes abujensis]MBB4693545.1 quercetin dioxygenase-like cupin family protein [Actinoplanes abujensis]GID21795.1 LuxR family transcriptional regulator [Actinoplanes abujensis]
MQKSSLTELAGQHLATARTASSGRSAHTVHGGHATTLRQTLIALAGGQQLDEHENPGEATVHVLHGTVRMIAGDDTCDAAAGEMIVVPDARHSLEALDDAVVLLSVAKIA